MRARPTAATYAPETRAHVAPVRLPSGVRSRFGGERNVEVVHLVVADGTIEQLAIQELRRRSCSDQAGRERYTRSTKLSTTRFSPAWSNWMESLLPSTAVTLPLPNL